MGQFGRRLGPSFGLTTSEIIQCVKLLREDKKEQNLKLLHFHIGSQITDIKRVKNAMKEAARVYSKIHQLGLPVDFLDIGGGLGVDYDGSKTRFESSMNYTVQEFATMLFIRSKPFAMKRTCLIRTW